MNLPLLLSIAVAFLLGLSTSFSAAGSERPNLLLITADDLGLQLGCYGDNAARTPHLDKLAKRSRLFENAYVAQASCSPSRSAMFTGLYPHANGQYGLLNAGVGFQLHESLHSQTLPALLKQAGYSTGILGKLHVGPENVFPFDVRIRSDTRDVVATTEKAGDFFRKTQQPYFFMANFSDPHVHGRSPRPPKEAFPTQYKGIPREPLKVGQVPPFPFQRLDHPEEIERITQYYNAVSRFDEGVGLLLDQLAKAGHAENTVVLFVSDHGPPFFRGKTSCYEGGVKVPMLLHWPGVFDSGDRTEALVSTVDILPTFLEAAGIENSRSLHGDSLTKTAGDANWRKTLATEFHYHGSSPFFPRRTIRNERFKLIHNLLAAKKSATERVDGDAAYQLAMESDGVSDATRAAFERAVNPPEFELYDLQNDPWEFDNLAEDKDHQAVLRQMKQALVDWRKTTEDPLLTEDGMKRIGKFEQRKKK
ncbi:sulfatase family protein [Rubinisphaera margarita]|uniref:sulfatase family protein n=1 Tax=Rubinisphaera margarita TaxID=2909586 RepID=UPI001EE89E15|nr:sulfatase [Rubinisphaera margarita]MCG6156086.1 sulfatase [Rubinisphaera margarita]